MFLLRFSCVLMIVVFFVGFGKAKIESAASAASPDVGLEAVVEAKVIWKASWMDLEAKLGSSDRVGCRRSLQEDQNPEFQVLAIFGFS